MPQTPVITGRTGVLLQLDLDSRTARREIISEDIMNAFVGGRGLAGWRLWTSGAAEVDDPRMPVLLCAGPLVGTGTPAASRLSVVSRSPHTGALLCETGGGSFASSVVAAGYDGIEIIGRSGEPCFVRVDNDQVQFLNAAEYADQTPDQVADRFEGFSTIVTGEAARSGVRFASLVIDRRFGVWRGGAGALFARRGLRGVAVRGSRVPEIVDEASFAKAGADIRRLSAASPVLMGSHGFSKRGNATLLDLINARHMLPTRNFIRTHFPAGPRVNAVAVNARWHGESEGCAGCHICCKRRTPDGQPLPGYESLAHFTAMLENHDLAAAVEADRICRRTGMDPTSCAGAIATFAEIQDVVLRAEDILQLVRDIAAKKNSGARLADGARPYAEKEGASAIAMTVKGLELPACDPRGSTSLALALATAVRGGCHFEAYPLGTDILRKPVATDRFSFSGKARIQKIAEDRIAAGESLGVCRYQFLASSLEEYARAFSAIRSTDVTPSALFEVGARVCYLERMLNRRFGISPTADTLPDRFFSESGTAGPDFELPSIDRVAFSEAKARYYAVRGLSPEGLPVSAEAERLGIPWPL